MSQLAEALLCLFALVAVAALIGRPFYDSPTLIAFLDGDLHPEDGDA